MEFPDDLFVSPEEGVVPSGKTHQGFFIVHFPVQGQSVYFAGKKTPHRLLDPPFGMSFPACRFFLRDAFFLQRAFSPIQMVDKSLPHMDYISPWGFSRNQKGTIAEKTSWEIDEMRKKQFPLDNSVP